MMWAFAIIFFVPGAFLLGLTVSHVMCAMRSDTWPNVEATILRADIEEDRGDGIAYRPMVRFRYSIAGHAYESDRIRLGLQLSASKKWAESVVARYPVGSRVTAAVDPQRHTFSVLEPGLHGLLFGTIAFSAVFVAVGLYAFAIAIGWAHFK